MNGNMRHLSGGFYIVRTQAGFRQAYKHFESGDIKRPYGLVGYPITYPSLVAFSHDYNGSTFVLADCIPIEDVTSHLESETPTPTSLTEEPTMNHNHVHLLEKALDAIHYYVDANGQELEEDGLTREDALYQARLLREEVKGFSTLRNKEDRMRFQTAYTWMKHGKRMRVPGFKGFWSFCPERETVIITTKNNVELDIRETKDVDFTMSFINSDEWEFYEGHDDPRDNV